MDHPMYKKQKVEKKPTNNCKELEAGDEAVLFNSDTLSKIISYLPSIDLLNLSLTNTKFGIQQEGELSLIKESARIAVQDIVATEEQLTALPHYEGESSLADYHYLQLIRSPLAFDQLVGKVEYVESGDKSRVKNNCASAWGTAISNNILRAGKHYVSFKYCTGRMANLNVHLGVMRPGQAHENASGYHPLYRSFLPDFSQRLGHGEDNNNSVDCCMYDSYTAKCQSINWNGSRQIMAEENWDGMLSMSSSATAGMLLDLDEGTLSVYNDGRKLGVMKRGLAGEYCWVVSMADRDSQAYIERGTIPP